MANERDSTDHARKKTVIKVENDNVSSGAETEEHENNPVSESKKDYPQARWDTITNEIETTADAEGYGIDKDIKETVVALNVFGINTSQSCEGHDGQIESGMSSPWIRIEAPDEPEERFNGQNIIFEKVAQKYNMPVEETKRMFNMDAYWEAVREFCENGETEKFKKWKLESEKLLFLVKELLADFYDKREVPENIKIRTGADSIEDLTEGSFEIFNGGEDYKIITNEKLSSEETEAIKARLVKYREEMKAFSEFLKWQYLSKGESYITEKRRSAQEKIDAEKLKSIRSDRVYNNGE